MLITFLYQMFYVDAHTTPHYIKHPIILNTGHHIKHPIILNKIKGRQN